MHEVLLSGQAERDLKRLPAEVFQRVIAGIRALGANPRLHGCRKLRGSTRDDYRIRVGEYRVVYEIADAKKTVRIMRVRHRREVYR
jgi:mRNA interferase RelE/StbE